jgi:hypothetical protein
MFREAPGYMLGETENLVPDGSSSSLVSACYGRIMRPIPPFVRVVLLYCNEGDDVEVKEESVTWKEMHIH